MEGWPRHRQAPVRRGERASKGNKAHGRDGTSEPRTRGEGEPDSSADEGLEVDLHVIPVHLFTERAPRDEPRETHRLVFGSVAWRPADRRWTPSERSDGTCARFPTWDRGPEASVSPPPRSKFCSPTEGLRAPHLWTSEIVADLGAEQRRRPRIGPGAHRHRGREPPGARLLERTGRARARGFGASRARTRVGRHRASGVRSSLRVCFRAATARHRFDPVDPEAQAS